MVAGGGALYRGFLLSTDIKLNKQSRTMRQGWSRKNNPQTKVLTTAPRALEGAKGAQGVTVQHRGYRLLTRFLRILSERQEGPKDEGGKTT